MQSPKSKFHGTVMQLKDLKKLFPNRNDFLNMDDYKLINKTIFHKKPLMFMPLCVMEQNVREEKRQPSSYKYAKEFYKIMVSGVLKDGRKAVILLDDILPYIEQYNSFSTIFKNA